MREYGQIQCAFWQSADATAFTDAGKLLACYLLTGPHSNGIGCYRCPDGYVMEDLGWSSERVSEGFAELFRNGFAYRFAGVVFIPKFLAWNKVANGNVATARIAEFEALPKGEAKARVAAAILKHVKHLSGEQRTVLQTVAETVSETVDGTVTQTEPNPTQPNPITTTDVVVVASKPATPGCPHAEIVEAYHDLLPELRRVRDWTADRQALLRARWREKPERQSLDWWRGFFGYVRQCPWLMGEGTVRPGETVFAADLEWLIRPQNFRKVIEGRYERRVA